MELDVSKFQISGEWLKLNLESAGKNKKTVSLLIKPLSDKESISVGQAASRDLKEMTDEAHKIVLDWDVKVSGKNLDCNEKNKKEFLPYICAMTVEGEEKRVKKLNIDNEIKAKEEGVKFSREFPKDVGTAILEFAQDFNNFIKK